MSVTGDFDALEQLGAFLEQLEDTATRGAAPSAAEAVGTAAADQYAAGAGPEGPWPPNRDGSVPLRSETAKISFVAQGAAVVAQAPDVLRFHQDPAPGRPARPVFPSSGELPASWAAPVAGAVERTIENAAPARR